MKTIYILNSKTESLINRTRIYIGENINSFLAVNIGIILIGGCIAFPLSFVTKSNVLIGFAIFPFALLYTKKQRLNYLYFCCLVLFEVLTYAYHLRIFYFFAITFLILFLIELFIGKVNKLILFLLAFMSPFFQQISVILGFPIRLKLSTLAGHILTSIGVDIKVEGNIMLLNGSSFAVDEACMGLNMLAFSMLIGVVAIAHQYRSQNLHLTVKKVILFFSIVFALDILCNLLRIMILVLFKITPKNPMHEFAGILCFILYTMIPIYYISKSMVKRFGQPVVNETGIIVCKPLGKISIIILSALILLSGFQLNKSRKQPTAVYASVNLPGFTTVNLKDGVTKLSNNNILAYVKPIPEFFTGEHTPLLCWKGSGYHFESIRSTFIGTQEIYIGRLIKRESVLYTAWWYSNGEVQTINQLNWRLRMLKGENRFSLINITSDNERDLQVMLDRILKDKLLKLSMN
jgi:exosortase N